MDRMVDENFVFKIGKDVIQKIENEPEVDLSEKFLDTEDVETMIDVAENSRDKALIALLWETGARISELYDLSLGDIEERKNNKLIILNGFTGKRKIPINKSIPLLEKWLSKHPDKENLDSSLWLDQEGGKITYRYIRKMLQDTAEEAGIQKLVNPQHFRRSRAAYLTKILPQEEAIKWFGWDDKSDLSGLEMGCSDCSGCPFNCSM